MVALILMIPAILAVLFWAADPFMIGYSRVLHVDALAGTFLTLSLLAACLHWHHDARRRWLVLSGVCAGLARTTGWDPLLVRLGAVLLVWESVRPRPAGTKRG